MYFPRAPSRPLSVRQHSSLKSGPGPQDEAPLRELLRSLHSLGDTDEILRAQMTSIRRLYLEASFDNSNCFTILVVLMAVFPSSSWPRTGIHDGDRRTPSSGRSARKRHDKAVPLSRKNRNNKNYFAILTSKRDRHAKRNCNKDSSPA